MFRPEFKFLTLKTMKIIKKRIRRLGNNLPKNALDKVAIPGIILDGNADRARIVALGFSNGMEVGETILPTPVGPVSQFNSEGREVPNKTKPKETRYREIEWCWEQWAGYGQTKTVCDFRLVPYERWQRDFISPPSVELTISKKEGTKVYITVPPVALTEENEKSAVHAINLILEIFRSCEILDENQVPVVQTTRSLNWTILPPGRRPWSEQKKILQPLIDLVKDKRERPVVASRFEDINKLQPEFTASGNQGFSGYIVFGFPDKNVYILESAFYGNAIYIFNED